MLPCLPKSLPLWFLLSPVFPPLHDPALSISTQEHRNDSTRISPVGAVLPGGHVHSLHGQALHLHSIIILSNKIHTIKLKQGVYYHSNLAYDGHHDGGLPLDILDAEVHPRQEGDGLYGEAVASHGSPVQGAVTSTGRVHGIDLCPEVGEEPQVTDGQTELDSNFLVKDPSSKKEYQDHPYRKLPGTPS